MILLEKYNNNIVSIFTFIDEIKFVELKFR